MVCYLPFLAPNPSFDIVRPVFLHLLQECVLLDVFLNDPLAQLLLVLGQVLNQVSPNVHVELVLGAQVSSVDTDQIWGHTKALGLVVVGESKVYSHKRK